MQTAGRRVRVLDADPELGHRLDGVDLEDARRYLVADTRTVAAGEWTPAEPGEPPLGLLVVDGLVLRHFAIAGSTAAELLGQGDLLRPWQGDCGNGYAYVEARWRVLEPLRLAVLDGRFASMAGRWPPVLDSLLARAVHRSRCLAFHLAITNLTRVDTRLLLMLWHLADRWGRVGTDGVILPMRLTHQTLAALIGAQRPSVTTALGQLVGAGRITRRRDGSWLLHGEPPAELRAIRPESDGATAGVATPTRAA